jgi:hypothetical protein
MTALKGHPQWLWLDQDGLRAFGRDCNLVLVGGLTFRDRKLGWKWTAGVTADSDLVVRHGALTTPMIPNYVVCALQARARGTRRNAARLRKLEDGGLVD